MQKVTVWFIIITLIFSSSYLRGKNNDKILEEILNHKHHTKESNSNCTRDLSINYRNWLITRGNSNFIKGVIICNLGSSLFSERPIDDDRFLMDLFAKYIFLTKIPLKKGLLKITNIDKYGNYDIVAISFKHGMYSKEKYQIDTSTAGSMSVRHIEKSELKPNSFLSDALFSSQTLGTSIRIVIESILQKYGDIEIIESSDDYAFFKLSSRGEIVAEEKLNELMDGLIGFYRKGPQVRIHLAIECYYAPGLGSPKSGEYTNMEPKYTKEVLQFGKKIVQHLIEYEVKK